MIILQDLLDGVAGDHAVAAHGLRDPMTHHRAYGVKERLLKDRVVGLDPHADLIIEPVHAALTSPVIRL